jgi:hypothetical protein
MQIECKACGTLSNANLTPYNFQYGSAEGIPVYSCETCGSHYIKLFSHAMLVKEQYGRYVPMGELVMNAFVEQEKENWDDVNWLFV